ncbi:MAG: CREG family protein [marine benthic group bacterium]|jgi:putative heme iron utilization protein|nr:CREG family protein [Gemmatimonadota bacterium]MCL7962184.1 CREG family protein [Candidatus Carthagonibacter metallireducens]MCL7958017.1 CREG family protein [Gemmatimonadota bacterium]MCL7964151.1 CREG family protein [Gemmatimonadota bacterium]MCL7967479.1 CREG family protein [Gemmatimonadota bacterium]
MTKPHGEGGRAALATEARELLAGATRGVLSTLDPEAGYPHASIIDLAPVKGGDIVTLLSQLAVHRKYAEADDRASVLIAPHLGEDDAMMRPRLTLVGHLRREDDRSVYRDSYLAVHPEAEMYLQLPDFAFFRLETERARYIAGFGRMGWLDGPELRQGSAG